MEHSENLQLVVHLSRNQAPGTSPEVCHAHGFWVELTLTQRLNRVFLQPLNIRQLQTDLPMVIKTFLGSLFNPANLSFQQT